MMSPSVDRLLDLSGKTALVTGGSRGIGFGIAARLAEAGAQVMISSVTPGSAEQAATRLREAGWQAEGIQGDVSNTSNARANVQATIDRFGRLDILVNNAGIFPFSTLLKIEEEQWDQVVDTNLKGAFFTLQAAAQQMIAQGQGGRIINIASAGGTQPTYGYSHYNASKGGMQMLTRSAALELGPHQITVNTIAPGAVITEGVMRAAARSTGEFTAATGQSQSTYMERLPLRRMGQPDDIATVALFLASSAAGYVTGSLIAVDGGMLLL